MLSRTLDFQSREAYNGGKMSGAGIERGGFFDSGLEERRPFVAGVLTEEESAYKPTDYQTELSGFLSSPQPQEIQVAIGFLAEQISLKEGFYEETIQPLRESLANLGKDEEDLRERKSQLRQRIARGEKTRAPTGGDFGEEVKIILGRMQVELWQWRKKPPNFLTKVLGRVFSFWAQETHPLISQTERQLVWVAQTKETHQTEILKLTLHSRETIAKLTSEKQVKEQELEGFLENWAFQDFQRLVFYLLENQAKIPDLLARYGREQVKNPAEREILTYLFWNLQAGFALGRENGDFNRWLRHFLSRRKKEDWQILLTSANWEELGPALRKNLDNFALLLGRNLPARRDFVDFLEWRIKEALARQGGVGQPSIPKPYFVKELPTSGLAMLGKRPPPEELKSSFLLVCQGKIIQTDGELKEVITNLTGWHPNTMEIDLLARAIQRALEDFVAQRWPVRGFTFLRRPVGEVNSRIRAGQWRILTRKDEKGIKIISIEHRREVY